MAQNFTTITWFPLLVWDASSPVVPGDPRRRVISFHNTGGAVALYVDVCPRRPDTTYLFQITTWPWFVSLTYKDWGEIVTYPWYFDTAGLTVTTAVVQSFIDI